MKFLVNSPPQPRSVTLTPITESAISIIPHSWTVKSIHLCDSLYGKRRTRWISVIWSLLRICEGTFPSNVDWWTNTWCIESTMLKSLRLINCHFADDGQWTHSLGQEPMRWMWWSTKSMKLACSSLYWNAFDVAYTRFETKLDGLHTITFEVIEFTVWFWSVSKGITEESNRIDLVLDCNYLLYFCRFLWWAVLCYLSSIAFYEIHLIWKRSEWLYPLDTNREKLSEKTLFAPLSSEEQDPTNFFCFSWKYIHLFSVKNP